MPFPRPLQNLIESFQKTLPGVGPKTAERFALALARNRTGAARDLVRAIGEMKKTMRACALCHTLSDISLCVICANQKRDPTLLCVVAEPQDLLAVERTSAFNGMYHVLGGLLSPITGITPKQLTLDALQKRITTNGIKEVILAFDSTMDGEATATHIKTLLAPLKVRLTRLARGLPMGSDIEYADDITLSDALKGRREV